MPDSTERLELHTLEPALPQSPQLRAIADDVIASIRDELVDAVDGDAASHGALGVSLRRVVAAQKPEKQLVFRQRAKALRAEPASRASQVKAYKLANGDRFRRASEASTARRVGVVKIDPDVLRVELKKAGNDVARPSIRTGVDRNTDPDLVEGMKFKKLQMYIRKVRCKVETDESSESDEILLGGTRTATNGKTFIVDKFKVSDDFDAGEKVDYGFSKTFARWNLATDPAGFPYVYCAVVVMGEQDDGGFTDFLKDLWEKVDEKVKAAIGAGIGAAIGSVGGPIGAAIGAVVGAIVGALLDLFMSMIDNPDDIIAAKPVVLWLGGCTKSYYDSVKLTSEQGMKGTLVMKGDGGRYEVDYTFKVMLE